LQADAALKLVRLYAQVETFVERFRLSGRPLSLFLPIERLAHVLQFQMRFSCFFPQILQIVRGVNGTFRQIDRGFDQLEDLPLNRRRALDRSGIASFRPPDEKPFGNRSRTILRAVSCHPLPFDIRTISERISSGASS
jgi:hypothetical protein